MKSYFSSVKYLVAGALVASAMTASVFAFDVQGGTVMANSSLNMRAQAATTASIIAKLPSQSRVCVLDQKDGWYKVASSGTIGYVSSDYVELSPVMNIEPGGAKVTANVLNLRSSPNTNSSVITKLSKGNVTKIVGINAGWLKVSTSGNVGYIHPDYVEIVKYNTPAAINTSKAPAISATTTSNVASGDTRLDVIAYAKQFLGVKYVYGGSTPKGFDCSGFTQYVLKNSGVKISRSSGSQYNDVSKCKRSQLNTGDLVFFSSPGSKKIGHVGIYISDGNFIHASSPGDVVKIDTLDSGYYNKYYVGGGSPF